MRWLALLAVLTGIAAACPGQAVPAAATQLAAADSFIYLRRNPWGGANTDTIVMARITETGLDLQNIHADRNLTGRLRPLCVIAGQVYFASGRSEPLLAIDVATRQARRLGPIIPPNHAFDPVKQRVYFRSDASDDNGPALRVIDLPSLSAGIVVNLPAGRRPMPILLSPDGKRLAFLETQPAVDRPGPGDNLVHVVDLENRPHSVLPQPISYAGIIRGGGGVTATDLLAWKDNQTLLTVSNTSRVGGRTPIGGAGDDVLISIELSTGNITRLSALPIPRAFVQIIPATASNELAVLLTAVRGGGMPTSVGRYGYDPVTTSLQQRPTSLGRFMLEGGMQRSAAGNQDATNVTLDGKRIAASATRPMLVSVSPDGLRLLYLLSDQNSLHLYDVTTQTDRVVDGATPGEPFLWFRSSDLTSRPSATAPQGFTPLQGSP